MDKYEIYNVLFFGIVLCIMLLFARQAQYKQNQKYIWIIVIILSFISGLRGRNVGIDTPAYIQMIENFGVLPGINEIGFIYLVKFMKIILKDYRMVLTGISFLTNALFLFSLWKLHDIFRFPDLFICYYTFCYFKTFSGIRQWLAVAIVTWAMVLIIMEKKYVRAIFIMVLSISIHVSAVFAFIFIPIFNSINEKAITRRKFFIFASMCFMTVTAYFMLKIGFSEKIINYTKQFLSNDFDLGMLQILKLLVWCIMFLQYINSKKAKKLYFNCVNIELEQTIYSLTMIFELLCIGISFLGYASTTLSRFAWYFSLFDIVFYANLIRINQCYIKRYQLFGFFIVGVILLGELLTPSLLYFT